MMLIPRRNNSFDLFDGFFEDDVFNKKVSNFMRTDIREKDNKYIIEVDVPGCEKENINLLLNDGYLEITAELVKDNTKEQNEKYLHQERFYGKSSRSFYVGDSVKEEDIDAEFKNGILKIEIPKYEETTKPEKKYIEIK